jgi:aminoglycoside phosphotransferase (APT) family kinase protein
VTASTTVDSGNDALNVGAVTDWIVRLGVGARAPLRFSRLGQGHSNLTFLVTDGDKRALVLRRPPLGELLASAHDVAREARILSALETTEVPAPRVLGLCSDSGVSDVPLVLMEHVEGLAFDDPTVAETLSPDRRRAIGFGLVEALARIHAVDLTQAGLETLASHDSYAARQLKRWHRQWELSRTRDLPAVDDLAERLRAAMPAVQELTLVHGDFHLRNVIVSPVDGSVRAVLDWELCTLGEPLADLGGLLAYWPQADERSGFDMSSALPGFPSREQLAAAYAERTGRSLEALGFWHVLALWKVAIIGEGVLRRSQADRRNAPPGAEISAQAVDDIVGRALHIAEAEGL